VREFFIDLRDGRRLAVAETGDPGGVPVVFHHGTPGNRLAHNLSYTAVAGARVVVYDRPGYGGSTPDSGRSVASCAEDVAAIADAMGVGAFAVFGSSGGGPHALACGALLGDRVTHVAVVAGFAPYDDPRFDFFHGMSALNIDEFRAAAGGQKEIAALLTGFAATAGDPDTVLDEIAAELSEADRRALARPEVRKVFRQAIAASLRDGLAGWIDDDLAFTSSWGFDLETITQPTLLMQGEYDVLVPRDHMAYVASKVPGAHLEIVAQGGHTLFDETEDVVRWIVEAAGREGLDPMK
jgi:pimeloyl-ACP methyl ester carboxylesterase